MPKIKTHRGAAKRFKVTGKGNITRGYSFANHILTKKTTKRKRKLRKNILVDKSDMQRVRDMLPNSR